MSPVANLYHYCSAPAFLSIIKNKSVWLSSLSLSNDSMEGRLVSGLANELAKEKGLSDHQINVLKMGIGGLENSWDGLGFCVSEKGDLLSQWRGYADEAHGFSIGFSPIFLNKLAAPDSGLMLRKVAYDRESHLNAIGPIMEKVLAHLGNGVMDPPNASIGPSRSDLETLVKERAPPLLRYLNDLLGLSPETFSLKGNAFEEEKEWRLLALVPNFRANTPQDKRHLQYRCSGQKIVPYLELPFGHLKEQPISEVILGSKNPTPCRVIEEFLKLNGFDAKVRQSTATYR